MKKRDYINVIVLMLVFLLIVFIITGKSYLYGSTLDWNSQHYNFMEYFRILFYKTKDIFPDFAFNIGAGQNIYNFSYYGLLNPIFLVSYFLPFISMQTYLIIAIIIDVLLSIYLMYYFMRNKYKSGTSLLATFIFLASTPLTFHSHRHIMFMSYMPFLLLSLIGVDRYFNKNKKGLLIVSLFLLIMTSYYFSISSIFVIVLYGVYSYLKQNRKSFFKEGFKFIYPLVISVLMSCVLIVPTFMALLNGRADTNVSVNIISLLVPDVSFKGLLYSPYTMGLTFISLYFIIASLFRKKEDKFLSISILITLLFPIITYILNATMYVEYKVLIPFIPLVILLVASNLDDLNNIDYKKVNYICIFILIINYKLNNNYICLDLVLTLSVINLYRFRKTILPLLLYIIVASYSLTLLSNYSDTLVKKDDKNNLKEIDELIDYIEEYDKSFYRTSTLVDIHKNLNRITNLNNYTLNVYSSISNSNYNKFVFDTFNNPIPYRNRAITISSNHYFYNNYMGVKYIIAKNNISSDYELIKSNGKLNLYLNKNAYKIGYVTNNVISSSDYKLLDYPYTMEAIYKGVVVDDNTTFNDYKIKEYKLDIKSIEYNNLEYKKDKDKYYIKSNDGNIKINLNNKLTNKVLLIRFNNSDSNSCALGDTRIIINGITNKLTCKEWKYHNNNYLFDYVISDDIDSLNIKFTKGTYEISDIKLYIVDKSDLISDNLGEFIVDKERTIGDNIYGKIDVYESGYFVLNIPYDKGFKIKVDGVLTNYTKVNTDFIGFKIEKGVHEIEISYSSPLKNVGLILSIIGFILFIVEECKNGKNKRSSTML